VDADGNAFGGQSGVTVSPDGVIRAQFDNGESKAPYRIPVAVVVNPSGLQAHSGNTYTETDASGKATLLTAGNGSAGTVEGGALEQSNVDLGTEFTRVIQAQAAYNFAVKVLRTADEMSDELVDISS